MKNKRKNKLLPVIFWGLVLLATTSPAVQSQPDSQKGTIYAILMADVTDIQIGRGMQQSLNEIKLRLGRIAEYSHLNLDTTVLVGDKFSKKWVERIIRDGFYCRPMKDYIFFIYLGHGFQTNAKNIDPLPTLYLSPVGGQSLDKNGMKLSDIRAKLLAKKPRFLLIVNESCNDSIGITKATPQVTKAAPTSLDKMRRASPKYVNKSNAKTMFSSMEPGSDIVLISASRGQPSYITPEGGFFSQTLFAALDNTLAGSNKPLDAMWQSFLTEVQDKTVDKALAHGKHDQMPLYFGSIKSQGNIKTFYSKNVTRGLGGAYVEPRRHYRKGAGYGNLDAIRKLRKPPTIDDLFRKNRKKKKKKESEDEDENK